MKASIDNSHDGQKMLISVSPSDITGIWNIAVWNINRKNGTQQELIKEIKMLSVGVKL